jgi:hypothetical protein
MTYAIIRGNNGRRHEVDFGDSPVRVEVYASEETVEISPAISSATRQARLHAARQEKIGIGEQRPRSPKKSRVPGVIYAPAGNPNPIRGAGGQKKQGFCCE